MLWLYNEVIAFHDDLSLCCAEALSIVRLRFQTDVYWSQLLTLNFMKYSFLDEPDNDYPPRQYAMQAQCTWISIEMATHMRNG